MQKVLFLLVLISCSISFGQTARFRNELKRLLLLEDSVWLDNANKKTGANLVDYNSAVETIKENVYAICLEKSRKTELKKSYTLLRMSHSCIKMFRSKNFVKRDKVQRLNKEVRRLKHSINTEYGIIEVFSFTIPILDDNSGSNFYDRNGPMGDPNLYQGNKKRLKRKLEVGEEIEYVPLEGLSLDEINEKIERELSRKKILPNLKKGLYSYVGIEAKIKKQPNRSEIPEIHVVLFFGAKRLHFLNE